MDCQHRRRWASAPSDDVKSYALCVVSAPSSGRAAARLPGVGPGRRGSLTPAGPDPSFFVRTKGLAHHRCRPESAQPESRCPPATGAPQPPRGPRPAGHGSQRPRRCPPHRRPARPQRSPIPLESNSGAPPAVDTTADDAPTEPGYRAGPGRQPQRAAPPRDRSTTARRAARPTRRTSGRDARTAQKVQTTLIDDLVPDVAATGTVMLALDGATHRIWSGWCNAH